MYCSEILQGNGILEVEETDNSEYLKKTLPDPNGAFFCLGLSLHHQMLCFLNVLNISLKNLKYDWTL